MKPLRLMTVRRSHCKLSKKWCLASVSLKHCVTRSLLIYLKTRLYTSTFQLFASKIKSFVLKSSQNFPSFSLLAVGDSWRQLQSNSTLKKQSFETVLAVKPYVLTSKPAHKGVILSAGRPGYLTARWGCGSTACSPG